MPPLHIQLWIVKRFVKAPNEEDEVFKYISEMFPHLSKAKFKKAVFSQDLMPVRYFSHKNFKKILLQTKKHWASFREVVVIVIN